MHSFKENPKLTTTKFGIKKPQISLYLQCDKYFDILNI